MTHTVFSKPFFRGWIVVVFLWGFFAAIAITCYPIWEGRASIARFFRYAMGRSAKQGPIEGIVVLRREDGNSNSGHESAAESDAKAAEKMG